MTSNFIVPFPPISENRHRSFYDHTKQHIRSYSNQGQQKALITATLQQQNKNNICYDCPVKATLIFFMPITGKKLTGSYHFTKPDLDNLEKIYLDCLQKAGILKNDSRICWVDKKKIYSDNPSVQIMLESLTV